jgi:16S rRNA (adenine1518-N6/adenine1519-N6)-dimethyltransferase
MTTPRKLLDRYDLRPLKRYGQSFLVDRGVIARIVESVEIAGDETVLEIGAGLGIMTALLADRAALVKALEIDRRFLPILVAELEGRTNVEILNQDVLAYDFSAGVREGRKIKVVGNVPYNISSQILVRLIQFREYVSSSVLMFQRELAERIVAGPGDHRYGTLSVLTAMYLNAFRVMSVSRGSFFPRPNVDSLVLKLVTRDHPLFPVEDHEKFRNLVRAAFAKRRKTLINSLSDNPFIDVDRQRVIALLGELGIDQNRRGETLTPKEFARLAERV